MHKHSKSNSNLVALSLFFVAIGSSNELRWLSITMICWCWGCWDSVSWFYAVHLYGSTDLKLLGPIFKTGFRRQYAELTYRTKCNRPIIMKGPMQLPLCLYKQIENVKQSQWAIWQMSIWMLIYEQNFLICHNKTQIWMTTWVERKLTIIISLFSS